MAKARTFMRYPGGLTKALTLSYDDGVKQDIRMIEILDKYGIKCTFNINGGCFSDEGSTSRRMTKEEAVKLYKNSPHEVSTHAYTHPWLEALPTAQAAVEMLDDRRELEKTFGGVIRGMAYPFGTYNDDVINVLKVAGIAYARTIKSVDNFKLPTNWYQWNPTCKHTDKRLMELAETFVTKTYINHPRLFYLWGHTYEFDDDNNWNVIEEFCQAVANKDDIWYATNIEIYDYVTAFNRLLWAVDMSAVHNPSAISVWVAVSTPNGVDEARTVEIKPGETLTL